jgi:glycosyltransferase involved in cell wall biosynthesis
MFFEQLLPELARAGHRVRVLAEAPPPSGERRAALDWDRPNLTVAWPALEYRSGGTPPPAAFARRQRRTFERLLSEAVMDRRPDVVLLGRESLVWYAPEVCRAHGLPTVLVAKGSPSAGLAAGLYPEAAARAFVERLRSVDLVVCVAHHLTQTLRQLGVSSVLTIPNVVDPERFRPAHRHPSLCARLDIDTQAPVVGSFCGLVPGKRPLDLIASAGSVLEAEPSVVYIVSGSGERRKLAQRAATERGIGAAFRWPGEIERPRMPDFLNLTDVVVHASEREGAPLTYLEAQACGRALVASDIPAAREIIADGRTGMRFPTGDSGALATLTLELLRDPGARGELGAAARAAVSGSNLEQWADAYARALGEELAASRASTAAS